MLILLSNFGIKKRSGLVGALVNGGRTTLIHIIPAIECSQQLSAIRLNYVPIPPCTKYMAGAVSSLSAPTTRLYISSSSFKRRCTCVYQITAIAARLSFPPQPALPYSGLSLFLFSPHCCSYSVAIHPSSSSS